MRCGNVSLPDDREVLAYRFRTNSEWMPRREFATQSGWWGSG